MKLMNAARKFGAKLVAGGFGAGVASLALATGPIEDALAAVDLSGVVTVIAAAALVIVAIAMTFKGPDVAKRVIRKV
jgi:hypothetical protein